MQINHTFRTLPKPSTLTNWLGSTPDHFVFCPKAHMQLTHVLKLRDAGEPTELFLKAIEPLLTAGRLGPVLSQLPPTLKCDAGLLSDYLALLPASWQFAFEFRHESWFNDKTYVLLRERNVAMCVAESEKLEVPEAITADFVYFRLRKESYYTEDRANIAKNAGRLLDEGYDTYGFFKHEDKPQGAIYAEELLATATEMELTRRKTG